ncbi:hypothetical protein [Pseudoalteromonas marina]|uniref:Uncharacterized protein n=1 Tax=Pseudoalteromonas marina TaxID=267375 RepID=A0ABT9FGH7_9GAMM|nr:hypothetical protein [Pseudoalteromonas marina]MDP2565887.1 hypothetical protein [Pseudoalteromonas marina]
MKNNLLDTLEPLLQHANDLLGEVILVSNLRRSTQSSGGLNRAILSIRNNRNKALGMLRVLKSRDNGIQVILQITGIPNQTIISKQLTEFAKEKLNK